MKIRMPGRVARLAATVPLIMAALGATAVSPSAAAAPATLYVSYLGSDSNACTQAAPCATISHAVSIANAGDTIQVAHGTYHEDVTLTQSLNLIGMGNPIINASQLTNGVVVSGAGAAHSLVQGFTVENATFEGILVENTTNVTIKGNTVKNNDQGMFLPPAQQTGECMAVGEIPGDCGEGLHLMSVQNSQILNNLVTGNSGGILVSDELGVTAHNLIAGNRSLNNVFDCGITIVAHLPMAAGGGVFDNTVLGNVANGDGVQGEGGGILLASGAPGGGVYNNRILFNTAVGNGLAGITIHNHAIPGPPSDTNGNVIVGNTVRNDALDGCGTGSPGDCEFGDTHTTGILVGADSTPITGTVIAGNNIGNVYYGIFTQNVPVTIPVGANHFSNVTVPVFQH